MKKIVGLMTAFILLHGCATVPENKSNTDRLATAGLLLCKPNEQCPIMAFHGIRRIKINFVLMCV